MLNIDGHRRELTSFTQKQTVSDKQLASGNKINSAADGAAAQQIIERLTAQSEGNRQAISNVYDGISMAQVAEGGLAGINDDVSRIRQLSLQAGNGMLSDTDKQALQAEITALQDNISQTAEHTTFGGKPLLQSDGAIQFQVGANAGQRQDMQTNDVVREIAGVLNIDITRGTASDALATADLALETVGTLRSELGAVQNQLADTARNLTQADVNTAASRSRLADLDYAQAASRQAVLDVQARASTTLQAMANQQQGQVLALLSE